MRRLAWMVLALLVAATAADAQTLGTFRWQLQPYCNVLSVTVVQQGGQYQLDGTDDQCGAAQQASVVGRAFPNPDGSIGFGLTTVTTTNATAIHIDVRLNVATLGGTWRDSAGNSGTFAFTPGPGTGGSARPIPAGGIAPGTITGAQIAAGTITATQLAPSAVSGAVGALGVCPAGQSLRGFTAGGAVCDPVLLPPTTTLVDGGPAAVGIFTSLAIGRDGVPIVSHFDATNQDLRVTHCSNPACTAATSTAVDTAGNVGWYTSLAIGVDGLAIISHYDFANGDLRVSHCSNVACTASTSTAVDTAADVGSASAIVIGSDGFAIVAHWDRTNRDLRVTHCSDVACTSATSATVATDQGYSPSIAIGANGRAIVSYQNDTEVRLAYCTDVSCTAATTVTVAASPSGPDSTDLAVDAGGIPTIAWHGDDGESQVTRCTDPTCAAAQTFPVGAVYGLSMAFGTDGLPVISAHDGVRGELRVTHCSVASCQTYAQVTVDAGGDLGEYSSLAIGVDGLPVISYRDFTNGRLRVAKCNSRTCQ